MLFTLIKNIGRRHPELAAVGISNVVNASVDPTSAENFAAALGISNSEEAVFNGGITPIFIASLASGSVLKLLLHKKLTANLLSMVHAEQDLVIHEQIAANLSLQIENRLTGIVSSPAGDVVTIESLATESGSGRCVTTSVSKFLFINKTRSSKKSEILDAVTNPSYFFDLPIALDAAKKYAKASGDNNPIHTNYIAARLAGLKAPVLQGMCLFGMVHSKIAEILIGNGGFQKHSMGARFSGLVYPGEIVRVEVSKLAERSYSFVVKNKNDKEVIKNGRFDIESE